MWGLLSGRGQHAHQITRLPFRGDPRHPVRVVSMRHQGEAVRGDDGVQRVVVVAAYGGDGRGAVGGHPFCLMSMSRLFFFPPPPFSCLFERKSFVALGGGGVFLRRSRTGWLISQLI